MTLPDGFAMEALTRMLRDGRISRRAFLARAATVLGGVAAAEGLLARVVGAQTTTKTELIVAQSGDISKLDPHLATGVWAIPITFNLYDLLTLRRPDGRLYPGLATEWKLLNPTTWQFRLRPGVRFHNGDSLTSADVKFSIERTSDPNVKLSAVRTAFTSVERVETPDSLTVHIHTKHPDALMPARLAFYGGHILPKTYLESVGDDVFNQKPIGCGPLRYVEWIKDDRVVFDAYRDYWEGKIDADRVVFRPIPEAAARIAALLRGEVDLITKLPPDHVERIAKNPTTKVGRALYAGLYVLAVNSKRPPLDNPKVKQALALAIDRETIIKELWHDQGIVPNGPIAKGDAHYDGTLPPLRYDPALARQRLKEAGYKNEEILFQSTVGLVSNDKAMAEAIVAMWRDVGVTARVEIIEASVRAQMAREKSFKGIFWSDPVSSLGDPDGMMWRLLAPGGFLDYWREPRFDELGRAAQASVDEKYRGEAYREMTKVFLEHLPWIPILQPVESYGLQRYVDWKPHPTQLIEVRRFNFHFARA
jgi:peptide/nickel transport system substrate-binding protein